MEASTAPQSSATDQSSATATIAGLVPDAAAKFADKVAMRFKRDGAWHEMTYVELEKVVEEVALGLIELGIQSGDRVCILSNTRPEWSYADMAITSCGATVVPIYQTNSAEECEWVMKDSGASAIVCEDESQLAKVAEIAERLPALKTVIAIDAPAAAPGSQQPAPGSLQAAPDSLQAAPDSLQAAPDSQQPAPGSLQPVSLEEVRSRGRGKDAGELAARREAVQPEDIFTIIYTSGTTGPPKGCVLTHRNYRAILDMIEERGSLRSDADDVIYLYLPLAHSFALLLQLAAFDLGVTLAYWGGDTKQIIVELSEVRPTYLPSVPRIFEKIYTLVSGNVERERLAELTKLGMQVRELELKGEPIPTELQEPFEQADEQLFKNVRAAFGGRLREAVTGAAPIAKEILEFFFACGVPVMEGYGMTETATAATTSRPEEHRFGSVGKPLPGVEVRIAEDGELLVKGPNIFSGYYGKQDEDFGAVVDGWLHTGDLGRIDEDGFVYIIGRKKDIIITAGGKNLTPANIENDMKQCRWVSQAVMHGDRRPYPVLLITLDEEEIVPWAQSQDLPSEVSALAKEPRVIEMIQAELDKVNGRYAQVEQVKRFAILEQDLSQETGELTPTLKVKRNVVENKYAEILESLYA